MKEKRYKKVQKCIEEIDLCDLQYVFYDIKGYWRKIPVERQKISRAEWRGKFSLKTGIFCKYPSQT
jgi:hypothetical protein